MMRDLLAPIVTLATIWVAATLSLDTLVSLYHEYEATATKLQGETWLREKCRDPFFYANMTSHTDICMRVEADHRVGAFFLALNRVTGAGTGAIDAHVLRSYDAIRALSWPVLAAVALACLLCPSLLAAAALRQHPPRDPFYKNA